MPETVRMALARCCQRQTNVTVQEKKVSWSLPLDKGHFITGVRFLLIFGLFLVSIILSVGSLSLMQRVSGEALESIFHSGPALMKVYLYLCMER
jgi:hypothetical protein